MTDTASRSPRSTCCATPTHWLETGPGCLLAADARFGEIGMNPTFHFPMAPPSVRPTSQQGISGHDLIPIARAVVQLAPYLAPQEKSADVWNLVKGVSNFYGRHILTVPELQNVARTLIRYKKVHGPVLTADHFIR